MIVKIGGSLITDKSGLERVDDDSLDRVIEVVSRHVGRRGDDLILIHGAGSFGHPHADRYGLDSGGFEGVLDTHSAVSGLNSLVVEELNKVGVDALPVHPLSCGFKKGGFNMMTGQIECMIDEGFLPVVHGDVVVDSGSGASVVSGDEVAVFLSQELGDGWLGMCSDVDGVLDGEGEVIESIESIDDFEVKGGIDEDVTGGIMGKVERLLGNPDGGYIFGLDDLDGFLRGDEVGTYVGGG